MVFTLVAFAAISDPAVQDKAVAALSSLATECKKDGKPYMVSSKASKCKVVVDKPGSGSKWTICYSLTFANEADMKYYETQDPKFKEILQHAQESEDGVIGVVVDY